MELFAQVRRFVENAYGKGLETIRMTQVESVAVAQVEPEGAELARAGRRFYVGIQSTATGRAPTATIPTTAAPWLLWNGEPDAGKAYLLEQTHVAQLSGTAAVGGAILWALSTTRIAAPTAATGYQVRSASRGGPSSKAIFADNQTLAVDPAGWGILDANGNPATTTNGGDSAEVKGRIIIPPGFACAFHYLSGTGTTPLFLCSPMWSELKLDLE